MPFGINIISVEVMDEAFVIYVCYHIYNLQVTFQQGFNTMTKYTVSYDRDIPEVFLPCGYTTCLVYGLEIESRLGQCGTCRNVSMNLDHCSCTSHELTGKSPWRCLIIFQWILSPVPGFDVNKKKWMRHHTCTTCIDH